MGQFSELPPFHISRTGLRWVKLVYLETFLVENRSRGQKISRVKLFSHAFYSNLQPPIKNSKNGSIFGVAPFSYLQKWFAVGKINLFRNISLYKIGPEDRKISRVKLFRHAFYSNFQPPIKNSKNGPIFGLFISPELVCGG